MLFKFKFLATNLQADERENTDSKVRTNLGGAMIRGTLLNESGDLVIHRTLLLGPLVPATSKK